MNIYMNAQPFEVKKGDSVEQAVSAFGAIPPYAILLNENFLPKSEHENTLLAEDDKVEVISAIQGG